MKTVYHLRHDRAQIADVRAATLSPKPFGLKATHGLFGSDEWWQNIEAGVIPIVRFAGTITRLYRTGMHNESQSFQMRMDDGKTFDYTCVVAYRRDRKLYRVGARVELCFVSEELKQPVFMTTGEIYSTHSQTLIEARVGTA